MRLTGKALTYQRAGRIILDRVDLDLEPGTLTAITGPSGSGKSTLLAILGRLQQPDHGTVQTDIPPHRTAYVLQAYALLSLLTAAENVEVALQAQGATRRTATRTAAAALAETGLTDVADHLTETLSGGQQQRVAIARALAIDPVLLIADEFSAELDPATRDHATALVRRVADRGGITLIATHDPAVTTHADRVLELRDGRLAEREPGRPAQ